MQLFWIDAFTDRPFAGNPAAVVPLDSFPPDARLQQIAFENGLSETAFFVRTGPARFHLRWFTPAVEVDLCGHATLATAFVLFEHLNQPAGTITFDSRSGPLTVARRPDAKLELDFPALPAAPTAPNAELFAALGRAPTHLLRNQRSWLCVYPDSNGVISLRPDHAALARLTPGRIIVTAPGMPGDCDFVSRYFAPDAGIPEDPVTGSAHCVLLPYWSARLNRTTLHARQVSTRGGELWCTLSGDHVRIAGHAVLYLRGEIAA